MEDSDVPGSPDDGKPIADVRSPMLHRALEYWNEIRGDKAMPARADLDPLDIPDLLANVILLDVMPPDGRLRVRLVGTLVVDMFGSDYTSMYLDEIEFGEVRENILTDYMNASRLGKPYFSDHRFRRIGGALFDIERVILPLSEDGCQVSMLLAVLDFTRREREFVLDPD